MPLDLTPERARVFRITHIRNIPWILLNGLHCKNSGANDRAFVTIGNPELIDRRTGRHVPGTLNRTLSDYVPFYFTPHSPMLLNIKTGYGGIKQRSNSEIVIIASNLHKFRESGVSFVFSDRHAYLQHAQFFDSTDDLTVIDWEILKGRNFSRDPNDPGKMERYQAEALALTHVPPDALSGIVCYDSPAELNLTEMMNNAGVKMPIAKRPEWYF